VKIGYARVSTAEQNPAAQVDDLRGAGCERVFAEIESGSRGNRPVLDNTLRELAPGDCLVVTRLDRLGRSLTHLVYLVDGLAQKRVDFQSLTEAIDTRSAAGRLIFHVMAALAQFERELLHERTAAGIKSARARGVALGRPFALKPEQWEHGLELARAGKTIGEIATLLGVSYSTVKRYIWPPV
jgi:DNA invertase Pin-like site-specific DNA recombinase